MLVAVGQLLHPKVSRRRNLPFVNLQGDRPPYLYQRRFESYGPHDVPNDFCSRGRPALRDLELTLERPFWMTGLEPYSLQVLLFTFESAP